MKFTPRSFATVRTRLSCLASVFLLGTGLAQAITINITTTADELDGNTANVAALLGSPGGTGISLREAVVAINNDAGGPHTISLGANTYTLTRSGLDDTASNGDLDVKKPCTIMGAGSSTTIIRGGTTSTNGVDKIFSFNPLGNVVGFPVTIQGVTLRFGRNADVATSPGNNVGGAMDFDAGFGANFSAAAVLTLSDVVFDQNSTTNGDGGGLALFDGGTVNATNCSFTNNRANSNAAGGQNGGAIFAGFSNNATSYVFTNCLIDGNATAGTTPGVGGGIYAPTRGLILRGCTITNNTAGGTSDGGGIFTSPGTVIEQGCIISNNTAGRWGGGVFTGSATTSTPPTTITNSTIMNNTSGSAIGIGGGGVFVSGVNVTGAGVPTISNSRVLGNTTTAASGSQLGAHTTDGAMLNAINNWYGTNTPPASFFNANVISSPFLVLAVTASPTTVDVGQMSTVTASITKNSNNQTGFTVPNGTAVSFSAVRGTMNPTTSTLTSGTRNSTFTGTSAGAGSATATVDNQMVTANITVTQPTQPPAITSGNNTTFVVGTAGSFTVTATGLPTPSITRSGTLPSGVTFTDNGNGTGTLAGTPGAGTGGTYSLTFTASNGVGSNAVQNFTLTVNQAPAITSANSTTFTAGQAGTFTVTKTGFPSPTLSVMGTLPTGVTFTAGTGVLSGTPAAGTGGTYSLTFTASNGVGSNATQNFTLTVNAAPAITSANSTTFTVGSAGTFTVTRTGFPNPTLMQSGTLPNGVMFNAGTGVLSGTPAAGTGGTYSLTFTASNGVGSNATQNFTLTVNEAPAITSANNTTFIVGQAGSFTVMKSGFPAPTLSVMGTLPGGVTFDAGTGVLSGTPATGTGGTYPITFTASNGVGSNATQNFTLTVNQAPAFTSANSATFTVGTNGSFTVTTSGFPAPTIARGGDNLPSNLSFTDNGNGTGTLSGMPAAGTGGVYNLTFTASNGVSGAQEGAPVGVTQNFTLTVNEAPAITSANSFSVSEGNTFSFAITATGFPAPSVSLTSGPPPSGVMFNASVLSGSPASGTAGTYPLQFTASNGVGSNAVQNFNLSVNAAACSAPPANLIAWFPGEGSGAEVQNGRNGTAQIGVTFAAGKVGQSFNFNAGTSQVTVPDDAAWDFGANNFTIQTWVKFNALTNDDVFVGHSNGSGANDKWIFWRKDGALAFHMNGSASANITSNAAFTPTTGRWYHVALTRTGNTWRFYVDGAQNGADQFDGSTVPDANAALTLGRAENLTGLTGALDEVQIFNRALSAGEIAGTYNSSTEGLCHDALATSSTVSRKTHGGAGDFDVSLPLAGTAGVESRSGGANGDHTIVVTFNNVVASGSASVSAGSVLGSPSINGRTMTVNLTGVNNAQAVTLTLSNVTDGFGQTLASVLVPMDVLLGDAIANRQVTASDVAYVKAQSGATPPSATTFRADLNADGAINATDIGLVKTAAGTVVP